MMHYVSGANATAHNWRLQHRTMHSANVIQALLVSTAHSCRLRM